MFTRRSSTSQIVVPQSKLSTTALSKKNKNAYRATVNLPAWRVLGPLRPPHWLRRLRGSEFMPSEGEVPASGASSPTKFSWTALVSCKAAGSPFALFWVPALSFRAVHYCRSSFSKNTVRVVHVLRVLQNIEQPCFHCRLVQPLNPPLLRGTFSP